jgi:hypothetical protein
LILLPHPERAERAAVFEAYINGSLSRAITRYFTLSGLFPYKFSRKQCYALFPAGEEAHRPRRPNRAAAPDGREAVQGTPILSKIGVSLLLLRDDRCRTMAAMTIVHSIETERGFEPASNRGKIQSG